MSGALPWAALLTAIVSFPAWGFCPSYTLSSAQNDASCGVEAAPGINPSLTDWQAIIQTVSRGKAGWGSGGPDVISLGRGCNKPMPPTSEAATFPCEILRGIAMQESGWRQFCVPDRPTDQVGGLSRTIISFDCGYGVSQVTSGMHVGESPSYDRAKVASDPLYNLATGASILASKWKATPCVGDNQPDLIEHWYSAVWAYNSLAYRNSPNNPNYPSDRGVWDPTSGDAAPYQEKIFGWIEHPPTAGHWTPEVLAYPDLLEVGGGSSPLTLSEPDCASPTDCQRQRSRHRSACAPEGGGEVPPTDGGSGLPDGGPTPRDFWAQGRPGCGCSSVADLSLLWFLVLGVGRKKWGQAAF